MRSHKLPLTEPSSIILLHYCPTMMLKTITGEACLLLLLLLAAISGVLQRDSSSILDPIYRPVLQPTASIPPIGTYRLSDLNGKPCIKVTMGVEYTVVDKKRSWYFNLDPSRVRTSGFCWSETALLSLTLPNSSASLEFTFIKEKKMIFVNKMTAHLSPWPLCEKCANRTYVGLLGNKKLFETMNGQSFKCQSETLMSTSPELKIKLVRVRLQAFSVSVSGYGTEVECLDDYNKRVVPIILVAAVVGLFLIALLTFLFIKERSRQDYERL